MRRRAWLTPERAQCARIYRAAGKTYVFCAQQMSRLPGPALPTMSRVADALRALNVPAPAPALPPAHSEVLPTLLAPPKDGGPSVARIIEAQELHARGIARLSQAEITEWGARNRAGDNLKAINAFRAAMALPPFQASD